MIFYNYSKIGNFWDKDNLLEAQQEVNTARKILTLKRRCLEKVKNQEWSEDDYKKFTLVVRKMNINRFLFFYDFCMLYLDLSNEECKKEIEFLNNSGLIYVTTKSNSFYELMASSISEFSAKVANLSQICINSDEKDIYARFENKIKYYETLLNELNDRNSDYTKVVLETFSSFIDSTVENKELKKKILSMENIIIDSKIKIVRNQLEKVNMSLENNKKHNYAGNYAQMVKSMNEKERTRKRRG